MHKNHWHCESEYQTFGTDSFRVALDLNAEGLTRCTHVKAKKIVRVDNIVNFTDTQVDIS